MDNSNESDKLKGVERLRPSEDSDFKPKQTITEGTVKKKGINWILILLTVFVAALAGVIAYFLFLNNNDQASKACNYNGVAYSDGSKIHSNDGCNICTCSNGAISCTEMDCDSEEDGTDTTETTTTSTEEASNEYEGWKTYEYEDQISFMYPSDWTVEEDITTVGEGEDIKVSVSKDDASFDIHIPSASGPSICIFSDTDDSTVEDMVSTVDYTSDEFTEVEGQDGKIYRRVKVENGYSICILENNDTGMYSTWLNPGYGSFTTTEDISEEVLETLDLILKSYL